MSTKALSRFLDAQKNEYDIALEEVRSGSKRSHWMWYIFPQIEGLGFSTMSKFYGIKSSKEALDYLQHPILGSRLIAIAHVLLTVNSSDPREIFGSPDDMKLHSSMTLFASLPETDPVFKAVLDKYFSGQEDNNTLRLLGK